MAKVVISDHITKARRLAALMAGITWLSHLELTQTPLSCAQVVLVNNEWEMRKPAVSKIALE